MQRCCAADIVRRRVPPETVLLAFSQATTAAGQELEEHLLQPVHELEEHLLQPADEEDAAGYGGDEELFPPSIEERGPSSKSELVVGMFIFQPSIVM